MAKYYYDCHEQKIIRKKKSAMVTFDEFAHFKTDADRIACESELRLKEFNADLEKLHVYLLTGKLPDDQNKDKP